MIAITERAKKALLAKKLDAGVVDLELGLRLASAPDGTLVLMLDWPRAGDHVVTYRESTVLLADPDTAAFVTVGRTVDCRRTTEGRVEIILRDRHLREGPPGSSEEPRSA
jgi:hypothetical protein